MTMTTISDEPCCRNAISTLITRDTLNCSNASLTLAKYFPYSPSSIAAKKFRLPFYSRLKNAMKCGASYYFAVFDRYKATLNALSQEIAISQQVFTTPMGEHIIIGLGNTNLLEAGLTLQPTYGTPYIPGTALKGLVNHYCHYIWGIQQNNPELQFGGKIHQFLFGNEKQAGFLVFYDAWLVPEDLESSLCMDIMTPHHQDYYTQKGAVAPLDSDMPVPISFYSIKGRFLIALGIDGAFNDPDAQKWLTFAFKLLTEALGFWGIGGKTNAGYGRLIPIEKHANSINIPQLIQTKYSIRKKNIQNNQKTVDKKAYNTARAQKPESLGTPKISNQTSHKIENFSEPVKTPDRTLLGKYPDDVLDIAIRIWMKLQNTKNFPQACDQIILLAGVKNEYDLYYAKTKEAIQHTLELYHATHLYSFDSAGRIIKIDR
jgi:CRISPR type III-B/RAMP module RAMP protein Cmr6